MTSGFVVDRQTLSGHQINLGQLPSSTRRYEVSSVGWESGQDCAMQMVQLARRALYGTFTAIRLKASPGFR